MVVYDEETESWVEDNAPTYELDTSNDIFMPEQLSGTVDTGFEQSDIDKYYDDKTTPEQKIAISNSGLSSANIKGLADLFKTAGGAIDWAKVAAAAGAGIQLFGDKTPQTAGSTLPIPKLDVTRAAINYNDPYRRPGSAGREYFTSPLYSAQGDPIALAAAQDAARTQAQGIASVYRPAARPVNPYSLPVTGTMRTPWEKAQETSMGYGTATKLGGIGEDKYYQNISDFMGKGPSQEQLQAGMKQYGVSQADVDKSTGLYPVTQPAAGLAALPAAPVKKLSDILSAGQLASLAGGGTNATNLADTTATQPNTLATTQSNDAVTAAQVADATQTNPTGGNTAFDYAQNRATGGILYAAHGRYLRGGTDGMADKINTSIDDRQPAKLSHGEFVIPADVVSHLGNGNSDAGAEKLYQMMARIRKARTGNAKQGKKINPDKFMPGGIAVGYEVGGTVGGVSTAAPLGQSAASSLSPWAAPYVTSMLGKTEAVANQPYQAYTGPLTAGPSNLQQQQFAGLSGLTAAGYTPTNASFAGLGAAGQQSYMNPYQQGVTNIEKREAQQVADVATAQRGAKAAQQGAFGGSRQAIGDVGAASGLATQLGDIQARGSQAAYTSGLDQFNKEQAAKEASRQYSSKFGLESLGALGTAGATQQGIEQAGIGADLKQFEEQRAYPQEQLKFQRDMITGMPISTQASTANTSQAQTAGTNMATVTQLLKQLGIITKEG
jgi:hypothetical protein